MPQLPPITKALMLACVVFYFLADWVPLSGWLALWPVASERFLPWQLLSYAFMHGSVSHLFFNMLGLWMFGAELERVWDQRRYLQVLGASVVAAALVQLLFAFVTGSQAPTVGASGALFGLLLAYGMVFRQRQFDLVGLLPMLLMLLPVPGLHLLGLIVFVVMMTNRQLLPVPPIPVPAVTMVTLYGGIELFLGVFFSDTGIAHFAHLGGMLGAWLMIRYWRGQPPFPPRMRRR